MDRYERRRAWDRLPGPIQELMLSDAHVGAFVNALFAMDRQWTQEAAEELVVLLAKRDAERVKAMIKLMSVMEPMPSPIP